jgi:mono/diheme cytochrome c family protein
LLPKKEDAVMRRLLSVLILAALIVGPASAFAQQTPQMEEFTSQDGLLTLSYPADWVAGGGGEDVPLPNAVLANSQDALDRVLNNQDPVSGDVVIEVLIFPTDLLGLTGVQMPERPTVDDYTRALADLFVGPETPSVGEGTPTPEGPQISAAQEITLGENIPAGLVDVSDTTAQGAFIVHVLSDQLLAITFVAAYPGEFTQDMATMAEDVAATIKYTGMAQDVIDALMAGEEATVVPPETTPGATTVPAPTVAPTAVPTATPAATPTTAGTALNGEQLVNERCSTCHSLSRVTRLEGAGTSRTQWEQIVDQMISFGAQLNSDERQAVIDYLVAQSGGQ